MSDQSSFQPAFVQAPPRSVPGQDGEDAVKSSSGGVESRDDEEGAPAVPPLGPAVKGPSQEAVPDTQTSTHDDVAAPSSTGGCGNIGGGDQEGPASALHVLMQVSYEL